MNFFKIFVFCFSLSLSVVLFVSGTATTAEAATSRCPKAYRSLRNSNTSENVLSVYSDINKEPKRKAESFFERTLTEREAQALVNAYHATGFLPKSLAYLKESEQKWILKEAGFSKEEIELILFYELLNKPSEALGMPQRVLIQKILAGTVSAKENNWVYIIGSSAITNSFNSSAIGRIIRSIPGNPLKIVLEMPDAETGRIIKITTDANKISPIDSKETFYNGNREYHIYAGVPEIGQIFTAYQSKRKVLSIKELNLPDENKSTKPRSEGIYPEYTKGWFEIQEQIAFGKALRNLEIPPHPHKTHIEYFALKIPSHINYIRNGITQSRVFSVEEKQTALHRLSHLEQEAR